MCGAAAADRVVGSCYRHRDVPGLTGVGLLGRSATEPTAVDTRADGSGREQKGADGSRREHGAFPGEPSEPDTDPADVEQTPAVTG